LSRANRPLGVSFSTPDRPAPARSSSMKSTERHHLKENEVALSVARAKETFEIYRKPIMAGLVAIAVLVAAVAGFVIWKQQTDDKARGLLAAAMAAAQAPVAPPAAAGQTPPPPAQPGAYPNEQAKQEAVLKKYLQAADAYPSSKPGIAARYEAASTLSQLGRRDEAVKQYQQVIEKAGSGSLYGQMARLAVADIDAARGQYDKAIAVYTELASAKDAALPVEGILMQMARAYQEKGSAADARKTYKRIVDEFPQSPYAAAAKSELDAVGS
jgi:tetratricopeptide (TPR) repeat protein